MRQETIRRLAGTTRAWFQRRWADTGREQRYTASHPRRGTLLRRPAFGFVFCGKV